MPGIARTHPRGSDIPYLLINPPLTDPTYPYHSISYLIANTASSGFTEFRCEDANINALNYLARPEYVAGLLDEAAEIRERVAATAHPTRNDELRFLAALAATGLDPGFMQRAIEVFTSPEMFYERAAYLDAAQAAGRFITLLSLRSLPRLYDGYALSPEGSVNLVNATDLSDPAVLDSVTGPFADYLDGPFAEILTTRPWRLIGLSVNYVSQLPFALRMARQIKAARPDAVLVFGGTQVADTVKYAQETADVWRIFAEADLVVPGEGESPLVNILRAIADAPPSGAPSFSGIAGVLLPGSDTRSVRLSYEDVASLPCPRYDIWDWNAYWSPEPVVLYSPTRGCYWNKCTFCDYGLNTDGPTSPSRERPADKVREDLSQISEFGRTLYFSVDAMSPRYLRRLSEAMISADLGFRWSAELRLERTFPQRGIAAQLKRAGCVAISFGYESASQRILSLIDKGVDIGNVPAILEQLYEAGIGAQMMGFTGFPSENREEARETYEFLVRYRHLWSIAAIGQFCLTSGSIVAKQPDRFGIELLPAPSGSISPNRCWRDLEIGAIRVPGDDPAELPAELTAQIGVGLLDRPFLGGIDCGHTLLYFARYGPGLGVAAPGDAWVSEPPCAPAGVAEIPFASLDELHSAQDMSARHVESMRRHQRRAKHAEMRQWLDTPGGATAGRSSVLVLPSGSPVSLAGISLPQSGNQRFYQALSSLFH